MNPEKQPNIAQKRRAPRNHQRRILTDRRKIFRFELDSERRRSGEPRRITDFDIYKVSLLPYNILLLTLYLYRFFLISICRLRMPVYYFRYLFLLMISILKSN